MRKGKVFRSVLAAGLAVSLAAAPMSVLAESADETELLAGVEDVLEESAQEITSTPYEWNASATFGDGLYNLAAQDGTDLSWLKGASCELKVVPGEDMLDGVLAVSLNDTQLAHVLFSADLATQMAYISIPEYFDQTIAFKPGEVLESLLSGAASSENGGSMQTQILQMIMGTGMEIVSQLQQYFTSIPADVWQQEMMNYVMPIMNNLTQESESGVLTVGSLSADVQTQTFSIPSEKMPEVISGILDSLSQDQVIGGLLESDAASSLCSVLTMVSGGSVVLNTAELKQQFQSAIESLKAQDLSGIPGIVAKISNSADQNAAAFELALNAGGQEYALYSAKAIMDGTENAFEVTPSAMLMSMYGVEGGEMALLGQGSTADGKLNEEIELTMNGASAVKMTISDLDLEKGTVTINDTDTLQLAFHTIFNAYNVLAAYTIGSLLGIDSKQIVSTLNDYLIKNGRIKRFLIGDKEGTLLISKHENTISYNRNLEFVTGRGEDVTLLLIIDDISRKYFTSDTSWLWDISFELLQRENVKKIVVAGKYISDVATRLEYAGVDMDKVVSFKATADAVAYLKDNSEGLLYCLTCFSDEGKLLKEVVTL